jgi:hypothetical protein
MEYGFFMIHIPGWIDGSEQEVLASGTYILDTKFYSQKKKKPTINICVVISLGGRVLYLSPSFPGSVNDREIVKKNSCGVVPTLWCSEIKVSGRISS